MGKILMLRCSFIFFILLFINCSPEEYPENDPNFTLGYEGVVSYKGKIFSGFQIASYPNGLKRKIEIKNGLQDGRTFDIYPNGVLASEYFYKEGKKVGIHRGWYESGHPRFYYEYNSAGENHGDHWEWQDNGHVYRISKFENGRLIGEKIWRKDGQIYSNYIYTPEKLYGVKGSKLCLTVKGDDTKKKTSYY